ncbi:hypothetical protein B7494_g4982 [Chlorociboria aeruginascens]|nr:hypothetical protein B7494_g4982 [Chlorociboria aeruginascens]
MLNFTIQFYLLLKPKKLSELPSFKSKFFQTQTPREQGGEEATKARELREYLNGILNNAGIPSIQQEQREYENPIGPTEMPDKFIITTKENFFFKKYLGFKYLGYYCLPTSEDPNGMNHWIAYALGFVYYAISTKDEKRTILPTPKETEKIIREGAKALNIKPDSLENFHKMRMPTEFEPRINDQLGQLQRIHDDGRRDYLTLPHSGPDHGRRKRRATMFAKGTVNFAIKMFAPRPFITVRDNM